MSTIDQQFVEFIVKSLVSKPEAVIVERRIDEKGVLLELTVDPEDLGRVIGKRGATAQSLRTLLRALGTKNDARYNLKIVDNGVGGHHGEGDGNSDSGSVFGDSSGTSSQNNSSSTASVDEEVDAGEQVSDAVTQTRKELEDLDDLDV